MSGTNRRIGGMTDVERRRLLGMGAGLAVAGALPSGARARVVATAVTSPVKTTNGPVIGLVADGVSSFKGLRYGAPPVGPLRFMPPRKPKPWTDPTLASRHGQASMQLNSGGSAVRYPGLVGVALDQAMSSREDVLRQSEDCLFLNVWTPALDNRGRAVMVWFHGGGFNYGSGGWPVYDGHNLAKGHDVVVVTVNHRLNAFGFMNVAGVGGHPASGNAGMLDLIAVLEWVRDNIAAFGGDPGRVTTFGQSGGGAKTSISMTMPLARGLVHKAIIQSGPGLRVGDAARAAEQTGAIMGRLGVTDLKGLQAVPAHLLAAEAAARENPGGMGGLRWGPMIDGETILRHPFEPGAHPQIADIPVIVGCTTDEMTLYNVGFDWWGKLTEADLAAKLRPQYGDKTEALIAAAKRQRPDDSPSYLYTDIVSKVVFIESALLAERKSAQPAPVYMYLWEWGAPVENGVLRAPHTMELPFVFDNVDKAPLWVGRDRETAALAKTASAAWTSFAKAGDPNGAGLPRWPTFDAGTRSTMVFDTPSRVENDPFAEFRALTPNARMF